MVVALRKNLVLTNSDDAFISDFSANFEYQYNYINNLYPDKVINGTIIGTLTNNNGVISGFTRENYLWVETKFSSSIHSIEEVIKIHVNNIVPAQTEGDYEHDRQCIVAGDPYLGLTSIHITDTGKLKVYISSNGTSNDIAAGDESTFSLLENKNYWIKFTWDGSIYKYSVSADGITYMQYISIASNLPPAFNGNLGYGTDTGIRSEPARRYPFEGSIDLNNSYVKINGQYIWEGYTLPQLKLYDVLKSFASYVTLMARDLPSGASIEWFLPDTDFLRFNSNNANIVERCTYTTLENGITVTGTSNYGRASFYFPVIKGNKYTVDFDSEVNGGYKKVYFSNKIYESGEGWDPVYGSIEVGGHKSYTFTATSDILWIGIYATATDTTGTITLTNIKLIKNEATKLEVIKGSLVPYAITFADTSKYIGYHRANDDHIFDFSNAESNTVTLTIIPMPLYATVVLEVEGGNPFDFEQDGYSITVSPGTKVRYTVSATDYITQSNVIEVNESQVVEINLSKTLYTYTIHPTPFYATVTLTATGYTQVGNSIQVPRGTSVNWVVSENNYVSQSGTKVVNDNCADNISLKALVEFTVTPTPSDATVTLIATGYSQVGNSIKVPYGTTVMWMVEKEGYTTRSGSKIMTEDTEAQIILNEMLTFTIVPSPSDAIVHLTSPGYVQSGNSITVPYGTAVDWEVSKEGMGTKQGRKVVTETESMEVVLLRYVTFTVTPTPSNATVELTAPGYTQEGNSITVLSTTRVHWKVYKSGYLPKSDYVTVNDDSTLPVSLTQAATLTINPTPVDAIVTLTAEGYGQYGNKITVPLNTTVYWSVVKTGYVSQYGSEVMSTDKTKNITLIPN